jgi:hypothetical protein
MQTVRFGRKVLRRYGSDSQQGAARFLLYQKRRRSSSELQETPMRTMKFFHPRVLFLIVGTACGSSNDSGTSASSTSTNDIATYQQLTTNVQNGAASYRTMMMASSTTTVADCRRIHDEYDAQVRSWVTQMEQTSGGMDTFIGNHGGARAADMGCVSGAMMNELDHHHSVACTFANLSANQAEAVRHVQTMLSSAGHISDRCAEMMRGTAMGSLHWGPMMDGCQDWNGHDCCGGMMGGAGMMGGMHHGYGCCVE